jgi:hypothetical protein
MAEVYSKVYSTTKIQKTVTEVHCMVYTTKENTIIRG